MFRRALAPPRLTQPSLGRDSSRTRFRLLNLERLEERSALATTLPPDFTESLVATNIAQPTAMAFAPDGRIFVAEKQDGIRVVENGTLWPTRFVTLSVEEGGERGVQNIVFDPNFATNGFVYVYYAHFTPTGSFDRLSRFQANPANPNVALPGETVILDGIATVEPGYHNGGVMEFGTDGMLYLGVGDLTMPTQVQALNTIHGKLLRLNVAAFDPARPIDVRSYDPTAPNPLVPADNPYVNTPGAWPIIYAYGFRNPFTGDIRPGTNTLYINDVGAGTFEEINQVAAGANYGWPTAEGPSSNPAFTNPIFAYPHDPPGSGAAITGGSFYTGSIFPSQYHDTYFYADYVLGVIRNFNPATGIATDFGSGVAIPVDIDQGPDGSLYWVNIGWGLANGSIHKISYTPFVNSPPTAVAVATSATNGLSPLNVSFSGTGSSDPNGDPLVYTWDFGDGTTAVGETVTHTYTDNGVYNVVLTVNDAPDGSGLSNTSQPIAVTAGNRAPTGTITLPLSTTKYKAGDTITFAGTASDLDEGDLPESAYAWSVVFHHNVHTHPFLSGLTGTGGTFEIPLTGEVDPDQWYRVHLTVTDVGGLQHSSFVDVLPETSQFTLSSNIAGMSVSLDGSPQTLPVTVTGVVGMTRSISAPVVQSEGGIIYNFVSWSDGQPATHEIVTPPTATTYTANYEASTLLAGFTDTVVAANITQPSAMAFAPDGRIFVAEKQFGVRVVENGTAHPTRFVTLSVEQGGDRGVQNLVFDPNFATNGFVYVYYAHFTPTASFDRLSRFQADPANPNVALPGETVILDGILTEAPGFHNGGFLEFGADGTLYLGVGDLASPANVQALNTINGKLLRLNVAAFEPALPIDFRNYDPSAPNPLVPADNPYVSTPGAWPLIFARGLRNPFTGDIKPGTNTLYINDVGEGVYEEVNLATAGANYGWPIAEGPSEIAELTGPVFAYPHVPVSSGSAIAGGSFYTSSQFPSQYNGTYFYGDAVLGFIRNFDPATGTSTPFATDLLIPVDVEQGPDGSLYWLSFGGGEANGAIHRFDYAPLVNQPPAAAAEATSAIAGFAPLTVSFSAVASADPDGDVLTYAWDFGDGTTGTGETASHTYATPGAYNVVLTVNDRPDGSGLSDASEPIAVTVSNNAPTGTITLPTGTTTYQAGDTISLAATASDSEDGELPASAYAWTIVFHHNTHFHPFVDDLSGPSGTFQIPLTGEVDPDQWFRVHLTVTDSGGMTHSSFVDIHPEVSQFTLDSNIAGLTIHLDGTPVALPATVTGVVGMTRTISAPATQSVSGVTYNFVSWSDGLAATHDIATPVAATTFTVTYAGDNQSPTAVAEATSPTAGLAPLTVSFSGAGSTDPNADVLAYAWDFGDGTTGTGETVSHTFTTPGSYNVVLTVNDRPDGSGLSSTSAPIAVAVSNNAPTGTVTLPASSTTYQAGDTISFAGTAGNVEDGGLPASAYSWSIVFHHNTHTHPFLDGLTGPSGTFQIPLTGEVDPDQWYRVHLTVTDSGGLTHSSFVDILPQTSQFTLNSNIAGLTVNLDGTPVALPATVTGVVGMTRTIGAPATQSASGVTYNFVSWSDGQPATHEIATPATSTTYTASYAAANSPPTASADSVTTTQETPVTVNVLSNDTDPNGDALQVTSVTQGTRGSVSINPDNTLRYVPNANYVGPDSFTYTISDGRGGTATGTVTVAVRGVYLLSLEQSGVIGGTSGSSVNYGPEDILQLSVEANGQYAYEMYFDGGDVGLTTAAENLDAFTLLADGSIVVSTTGAFSVPGPSGAIAGNGEDLLRFVPTTLGDTTAGTWSFYFDGSDVSLTNSGESIDGLFVLADGRLILSLNGNFNVGSGVSGQDEDLVSFSPTSLGTNTAGVWALYFDGSDVSLATSPNENVTGVFVRETGVGLPKVYLSTIANFSVPGMSGQNEDIFAFNPTSLGADTAGTYGPGLTFDGSAFGLSNRQLDGFFLGLSAGSASAALRAPASSAPPAPLGLAARSSRLARETMPAASAGPLTLESHSAALAEYLKDVGAGGTTNPEAALRPASSKIARSDEPTLDGKPQATLARSTTALRKLLSRILDSR